MAATLPESFNASPGQAVRRFGRLVGIADAGEHGGPRPSLPGQLASQYVHDVRLHFDEAAPRRMLMMLRVLRHEDRVAVPAPVPAPGVWVDDVLDAGNPRAHQGRLGGDLNNVHLSACHCTRQRGLNPASESVIT